MRDDPLFLVMATAMLVVVVILLFGIGSFAKGGEFNKKYANKAMRWRIIAFTFTACVRMLRIESWINCSIVSSTSWPFERPRKPRLLTRSD